MRSYIPKFFGIEQVSDTETFLVLEDITENLELPCIMDVKIGAQTWDPDASKDKIASESKSYPGTKKPFGFSICGMLIHSLKDDEDEEKLGKNFGRSLQTQDVDQVPKLFFNDDENPPKELVGIFVEKISHIVELFEIQQKYEMYASSVLLAYDAMAVRKFQNGKISAEELKKSVRVRMIDFAHVFPAEGEIDDNYLFGIKNLLDLFVWYQNQ